MRILCGVIVQGGFENERDGMILMGWVCGGFFVGFLVCEFLL